MKEGEEDKAGSPTADDRVQDQSSRIAPNLRGRTSRTTLWLSMVTLVVYLLYGLSPVLDPQSAYATAGASTQFDEVRAQLIRSMMEEHEPSRETVFRYRLTQLVDVSIPMIAKVESGPTPSSFSFSAGTPHLTIRYDQVVLLLGLFAVFLLTFRTLLPSLTIVPGALEVAPISAREESEPMAQARQSLTAIGLFEREVKSAERRAEVMFSRSTLLLGGGIIMAFVGVTIFYMTLPDTNKGDTIDSYWLHAIRPAGVLVFVEAIAWFLLRQYRALIEDYKWFHRIYMKRANYLAALLVLDEPPTRPEDVFIAASLVNEDLSGKLKKGETTEALEKMKMGDESPITEILGAVSRLNGLPGSVLPKGRKKKNGTPVAPAVQGSASE